MSSRHGALDHDLRPVEQEIVVIEHVLLLLGFDIGAEQLLQLGFPFHAPRKEAAQHLAQRRFGVDDARVDGKAGSLHRKALVHFGEAEVMADQIHQIGGIFAVVDREAAVDSDVERVLAQQPRADRMKRSRPAERIRHRPGLRPEHLRGDALDPPLHFGGGAAREGEQHDPSRVRARDDEMRHAVGERVGLAGARARDDEQWRGFGERLAAMLDGAALLGVELGEIGGGHQPPPPGARDRGDGLSDCRPQPIFPQLPRLSQP